MKVSVTERFCTAPPPVFVTSPDIGYVTTLFDTLGVPHVFVASIAQVLKLPSRIDFIAAVFGLLPEVMLANMTLLKQGALPPKIALRSTPPSWNCNAGIMLLGNPAVGAAFTLNPVPGG